MGTKAAVPVEEYLRTSYPDLDREYRDGEVVERILPDTLHAKVQVLLSVFFWLLRKQHALFPYTETRMKIGPKLYLIPDVAVFYQHEPGRVPDTPPLIAIEILSPDDRMSAVREKLETYKQWGVPHAWLVDPESRRLYTCDAGLREVTSLHVAELGIELKPSDIFDWN